MARGVNLEGFWIFAEVMPHLANTLVKCPDICQPEFTARARRLCSAGSPVNPDASAFFQRPAALGRVSGSFGSGTSEALPYRTPFSAFCPKFMKRWRRLSASVTTAPTGIKKRVQRSCSGKRQTGEKSKRSMEFGIRALYASPSSGSRQEQRQLARFPTRRSSCPRPEHQGSHAKFPYSCPPDS